MVIVSVTDKEAAYKKILALPNLIRLLRNLKAAGAKEIGILGYEADDRFKDEPVRFVSPPIPPDTRIIPAEFHFELDALKILLHTPAQASSGFENLPATLYTDLKSDPSGKKTEKLIFSNIRKKTEGWAAKTVNKTISFALTKVLLKTKVTPNQITLVNLFIAVAGAVLLASSSYAARVGGAFLMAASSIIDGCDGEIARIKVLFSDSGAWFDTVADDVANNLFLVALFWGITQGGTHSLVYWKAGWFFAALSVGVTGFIYHQLISAKKGGDVKAFAPAWDSPKEKKSLFERLRPLMKRDFFIWVIFLFVIIDKREIIFWMSAVGTTVTFILYAYSFLLTLARRRS